MERMPLGVSRFDEMIGGGAPAGSVVVAASEAGAGGREFCYTATAMNGLAEADTNLFEFYYGEPGPGVTLPHEVHYVTFTSEPAAIVDEMRFVLEDDLVDSGTEPVSFADLSREFFQMTPVPTEWYNEQKTNITSLGTDTTRQSVLEALGDYLSANAAGNLVIIDSISDLLVAAEAEFGRANLAMLLKGLKRAAYRWGGLLLLLVNVDVLDRRQLGRIKEAADGTLLFEWESGGSERDRTLVVEEFRGVLSRLEKENIVRFETEIRDSGFDISNVRKIR
ncbi:HTR-like protein [Halobacteria archaeon AArc-curdl1]|uniref:HTR-like protein n=1 Tax=Natronosalvus hydrolyticus TaxID=2979988 RepID=A0AAP2Z7J5_9EURY|nr:HTR-like protein [Halobacteria archaeon AArc-curdl1]